MAYSFFWNEFPTQLTDIKDALPLVLDIYRGKTVARDDAAKALFNVAGFVYKSTLSKDEPPTFGSSATTSEVESAFASAIAASQHPVTMEATPMGSAWLTILAPVVLELLKKFLTR